MGVSFRRLQSFDDEPKHAMVWPPVSDGWLKIGDVKRRDREQLRVELHGPPNPVDGELRT